MQKTTITFFNLWVILLSVLGLNSNAQTYLDQLTSKSVAQTKYIEYNHPAPLDENHYAAGLDTLVSSTGLHLQAGDSGTTPGGIPDVSSLTHCKSLVYRTLESLPQEQVSALQNLTLNFDDSARRGLAGGSTLILRCSNVTDEELVGVLVHEMGHIVSTGEFQGTADSGASEFHDGSNPIYNNDPSLGFYRISFLDEKTMRPNATPLDFVSGYAQTDCFEDFAETYNYYVLHGDEFRDLILTNDALKQKYDYMKNVVFHGKEFFNGSDTVSYLTRNYDTTILSYDMNKFFTI